MDVRSASAHELGHLAGSVNLPFDLLRYQMESLAADREYVVYCEDGSVSTAAAYLLTERNFRVAVLKRGLRAVPQKDMHREAEAEAPAKTPEAAEPTDPDAPAAPAAAVSLRDYRDQGVAEAKRRIKALEGERTEVNQRSQKLEGELSETRQRSQELERELAEAKQHGGEQEAELAKLKQQNLELKAALTAGERRIGELEQRYEDELAELRSDLAAAQKAAAAASPAPRAVSGDELLHLKQALNSAEAQLSMRVAELAEAEDRHIAETDEVHQLWEKRLHQLEQDIERVRAERDEWRQRCQERVGE